jgi:hypothetical protein
MQKDGEEKRDRPVVEGNSASNIKGDAFRFVWRSRCTPRKK